MQICHKIRLSHHKQSLDRKYMIIDNWYHLRLILLIWWYFTDKQMKESKIIFNVWKCIQSYFYPLSLIYLSQYYEFLSLHNIGIHNFFHISKCKHLMISYQHVIIECQHHLEVSDFLFMLFSFFYFHIFN